MPVRKNKSPLSKKTPGNEDKKDVRPQHYVYMEKGVTKNLGDYNSARITVGITVQVEPTPDELKQVKSTIKLVSSVLDDEILNQIEEFEKTS